MIYKAQQTIHDIVLVYMSHLSLEYCSHKAVFHLEYIGVSEILLLSLGYTYY